MKGFMKKYLSLFVAFLLVCTMAGAGGIRVSADTSKLKVAILNLNGSGSNSYRSILQTLKSYKMDVNPVSAEEIQNGKLSKFDVLVVPDEGAADGATKQAEALGSDGCRAIEKFANDGGGYVGVGSGAFLAAEGYNDSTSNLVLVNAKAADVEHWNRGSGDVQVQLSNSASPILQGYSGMITVHYENGAVLQSAQVADIPAYTALASYISDVHQNSSAQTGIMPGSSAITASNYGNGKCVLFSFNPELTEGLGKMFAQGVVWAANSNVSISSTTNQKTDGTNMKAVWLWGSSVYDLGTDGAKIITDQLKQYGFTDIFLLVKGTNGTVAYNSKIALQLAHPDRDILKEVIDQAHQKGIKVHAWFILNTDTTWAKAHPEDRMVHITKGPNTSGYISPLSSAYRSYVESLVREVVQNYDVDGIQMDGARYTHIAYGFNENYEIPQAEKLGINVDRVKDLINQTYYTAKDGKSIFEAYDNGDKDVVGWVNLRKNAYESFTNEIKNIVKSTNPELRFSDALMPEGAYNSNFLVAQNDSKTFAEVHYGVDYNDLSKIYDFVAPMLYCNDYGKSPQWTGVLYKNTADIFGKDRVVAGLQAYSPATSSSLADSVNYIAESGGNSLSLFRFGTFGLSTVDLKNIGHNEKQMEVTMTDPLNTDNTANVDITKVEIKLQGNLTVKSLPGEINGCPVSTSSDGKTITITGAPCIPQNGTIKLSAVVNGDVDKGIGPAQVQFFVTNSYSKVRVYNQTLS